MSVSKPDRSGGSAGRFAACCGDSSELGGTPMRVLALHPSGRSLARCAGTDGIPVNVETALIQQLEPGAIVLVQAGMAVVRLDAEWVP